MSPIISRFLVLIVTFILQATLVPHFKVFGVQPDLILIVVVIIAFLTDPFVGSVTGFVGGLLEDLISTRVMGLNALSKTIVGYLGGLVKKTIFAEPTILLALAIFIATLLDQSIYIGVSYLLGHELPLSTALLRIILPTSLYNSLISPFVYLFLTKLVIKKEKLSVPKD